MKHSTERERLLAEVRKSRGELSSGLLQTREAVDFSSRVKASVQKNLLWWLGGAALTGLFIASATGGGGTRTDAGTCDKVKARRKGALFATISKISGFLFSLSSPILKAFLTREVANALSKISRDESTDS